MEYMGKLTGLTEEDLANDLRGVIFLLPNIYDNNTSYEYVTADEYLSGNVREKLNSQTCPTNISIFIEAM